MHRILSFVRHGSRSSSASSLPSLFEANSSLRSSVSLGTLRSHGSPESASLYKCFSGLPQSNEHVRGFSSMNSGWNILNRNVNASQGSNPDSQRNVNPLSENDSGTKTSSGWNIWNRNVNASQGFNPDSQRSVNPLTENNSGTRTSSGWKILNRNLNASQGFNPDSQRSVNPLNENDSGTKTSSSSMDFVRRIIETDGKGVMGGADLSGYNLEHEHDVVHIKLLRNNTFVTVTDSKGNVKMKSSVGCLKDMKGGQKLARYAAEATAEEVGRRSRVLGLKSVVVRVKGFTYFKKKRQAIESWREGFTNSRAGRNPIICVEDTTRIPHNGCRRPKKRRI